jgi:Tfp pilus assembly PilM family ATPase
MARYLGIDITATSMRGVLVKSAMRKAEVERYVEIPLTAAPGDPARGPELADAGASLLRALPASPDSIIAAVDGEITSLRALELPAAARKRLTEIIPFELEAVLPYEPSEAVIGYQITRTTPDELRVLTASVLRRHVVASIEMLRAAGVEPTELAAGAAALDGLPHLVPDLEPKGPILLIDLERDGADVCLLEDARCTAARTLAIGLSDTTDTTDELQRELQRTIAGFQASGAAAPTAAYVTGSMASAQDLVLWLSTVLAVPCKLLTLPSATQAGSDTLGRANEGAAPHLGFARAAALAARSILGRQRIDLRSGDLAPTHRKVRLADHASLAVTCAVVVVLSAMFSLKARQSLLSEEQVALQTRLETVTDELFGTSTTDATTAQGMLDNPKNKDPLPRFDAFDALAAVSDAIPEELQHELRHMRIDVAQEKSEGTLELRGSLESLGGRDSIVSLLEQQGCFRDIQLGRTSPVPGQALINYQLEAVVQCPGEGPVDKKKKKAAESEEL